MADISLRAVQRRDYPVQPNSDSFVNHLPDVASGDDGRWVAPGSASQGHQAQVVGTSPESAPEWHPEGAFPLAVLVAAPADEWHELRPEAEANAQRQAKYVTLLVIGLIILGLAATRATVVWSAARQARHSFGSAM